MSRPRTRLTVYVDDQRFRWYDFDGVRQSFPIPDFATVTKSQLESRRLMLELTVNNNNLNPLTGAVLPTTMTVEQLWEHYKLNEIHRLKDGGLAYQSAWKLYIRDQWGSRLLHQMDAREMEIWFENLQLYGHVLKGLRKEDETEEQHAKRQKENARKNGKISSWRPQPKPSKMMSKEYKLKIKTAMSAMFQHAVRWKFIASNPISCGGTNIGAGGARGTNAGVRLLGDHTEPMKIIFFGPECFEPILDGVIKRSPQHALRHETMILVASEAFRRGEIALKWQDILWGSTEIKISHSYNWQAGVDGKPKNKASATTIKVAPIVIEKLAEWYDYTPYKQADDYVFASTVLRGKKPLQLEGIFKRYIRPVIIELGLAKATDHIGWHSMRHAKASQVWAATHDKQAVREALRHGKMSSVTYDYIHLLEDPEQSLTAQLSTKMFPSRAKKRA